MPIMGTWAAGMIAAVMVLAGAGAGFAQGRIGTAVRVVNQVTADKSLIVTGDGVSQNQTVEVAAGSLGELKLDDATKLALGPGAKLVLDKFVYNPDKGAGDVSVSLAKGAFRFITGAAQKRDYKIKTPSAAISVRGTVFDVYIAADGSEWLLLHEGSIEVCNTGNKTCRVLDNPCNVLQLSPAGAVGQPGGWGALSSGSNVDFDVAFPFVKAPPTVDPVVYHTRVQVEANQCPDPNAPLKNQFENTQRAEAPQPGYSTPPLPAPKAPDYPTAPEPTVPPVIPVSGPGNSNWSGVYFGGTMGHGTGTQTSAIECNDRSGFSVGGPSYYPCSADGFTADLVTQSIYETRTRGFIGGGQGGFNFQAGNIVAGFEGDLSLSDIQGGFSRAVDGEIPNIGGATLTEDIRWFGTMRGRAGLAFGNVLVFATGGVAMGDVAYNYTLNARQPGLIGAAETSQTKVGWAGGGGFEIGFGLWSFKTEYIYYDLGREKLQAGVQFDNKGVPVDTGLGFTTDFETQGHIVRTGLSYHFN